jgi:hypothetical protein
VSPIHYSTTPLQSALPNDPCTDTQEGYKGNMSEFFGETELRVLCLCNGSPFGQTKIYHEGVLSPIDAKKQTA